MHLLDFVFLKLVDTYGKKNKESGISSGTAVLGGLYSANIMFLTFIYKYLFSSNKKVELWWILVVFGFGQIFTYFWYIFRKDKSIERLEVDKNALKSDALRKLDVLAFLYIIGSVISFIGGAILFHYLSNE